MINRNVSHFAEMEVEMGIQSNNNLSPAITKIPIFVKGIAIP